MKEERPEGFFDPPLNLIFSPFNEWGSFWKRGGRDIASLLGVRNVLFLDLSGGHIGGYKCRYVFI